MKYKILFLVSAIFLQACSNSDQNENQRGPRCETGIINGTEVSEADPFAKRVALLQYDVSGSCTATLISPNVLLTAAHCVRGKSNLRVSFGIAGDACATIGPQAKVRRVVATRVHENYDDRGFSTNDLNLVKNDIALVRIKGEAPRDMVISRVYDERAQLDSSELIAVGYGDTTERSQQAPLLRRVTKSLRDVEPTAWAQQLTLLQPYSGICTGDSGGPQFVRSRGQYQIYAINSAVAGLNDQDYCRNKAVLMFAPYFADWISRNLRGLR
ncbi:MAG: trypsin-like serine protease [Proteobacteria bacterium]|nr:MAG: trypsin-like serine protease [Pseudomonadota bacterium]